MNDIDKLWQDSKFDGALPEDGMYYGTVKSAESKTTDKGYEIFEITTVVDEGEYAGLEAVQSIFYFIPSDDEKAVNRTKLGLKNIRTLARRLDPRLDEIESFTTVLGSLETLLPGRRVSLEQKTSTDGKYKNIYHHEVFDSIVIV